MNWNDEARREANRATEEMFQAHRGAFPFRVIGYSVAFGNDAYSTDDRTKAEVNQVREYLKSNGLEELGFGIDDEEGYTWAMIVRCETSLLFKVVWWAFGMARGLPDVPADPRDITGMSGVQGSIASGVVADQPGADVSEN